MKFFSRALVLSLFKLVGLPLVFMMLGGCLNELSGTNYDRVEARSLQTVHFGEIVEIESVKLEGTQSGIGAATGAAVGGIGGSKIGGGKGKSIATIAGVVAGGLLGNMVEKKSTESTGLNLTVRLDSGEHVSVVQQGGGFRIGDRVKVLVQGRSSRVVHTQY